MEGIVTITSKMGLHARPAAQFVQKASSFPCTVSLLHGERKANGKSIMSVMALGVAQNQQVTVVTEGEKEAEALAVLVEFLSELKE